MIGAVVQNVIGGFLQPRASVRRILDGGHGFDVVILMVLLAILTREIFILIFIGGRSDAFGLTLALHVQALVTGMISFLFMSALVFGIGRVFGGTGSWREANLAMAWYLLVISVVVPLVLPAVIHVTEVVDAAGDDPVASVDIPAKLMVMFTVASGVILWLFACYIAELHRFASAWSVLAVMLGLLLALAVIVTVLAPPV